MKKIVVLLVVGLLLSSAVFAMGGTPPAREVEIIENIAAQTEEAMDQEKYEMKALMEIPWGSGLGELGVAGMEGMIIQPERLAVDGKENVYIFDPVNNRINKYDNTGRFVRDYPINGLKIVPSAKKNEPPKLTMKDIDMGVDENGNLYVFNEEKMEIRKISHQGKVVAKQAVLPGTKSIKVERNGKVQTYDVSGERLKIFDVFETPGGLKVEIGALANRYTQEIKVYDKNDKLLKILQQTPAKASQISVYNEKGDLVKEINIRSSLALWSIRYLGIDINNDIYLYINRGTGKTVKWQVSPNAYWETEATGDYVRIYGVNGDKLAEIELMIPIEEGQPASPNYYRGLVVNKNGDILMLARYGDPFFMQQGSFKIFRWKKADQ